MAGGRTPVKSHGEGKQKERTKAAGQATARRTGCGQGSGGNRREKEREREEEGGKRDDDKRGEERKPNESHERGAGRRGLRGHSCKNVRAGPSVAVDCLPEALSQSVPRLRGRERGVA